MYTHMLHVEADSGTLFLQEEQVLGQPGIRHKAYDMLEHPRNPFPPNNEICGRLTRPHQGNPAQPKI